MLHDGLNAGTVGTGAVVVTGGIVGFVGIVTE
jgi:hypothetical protein